MHISKKRINRQSTKCSTAKLEEQDEFAGNDRANNLHVEFITPECLTVSLVFPCPHVHPRYGTDPCWPSISICFGHDAATHLAADEGLKTVGARV